MEFRSFFKNIFNSKMQQNAGGFTALRMLNSYTPYLIADNTNAYDNLIIRACVDCIARHTAKLTPKMLGFKNRYLKNVEYLLTVSPNIIDNPYNFFYKITSQLLTNNNAFVYINYTNDGNIEGFYPVPYSSIEFLEKDNQIFCKFYFKSATLCKVILPYSELIHLKRHYNENDIFGSEQSRVLNPVLKLLKSFIESFINAVYASSILRGYIKYAGNLKESDLKAYKNYFVSSYMSGADGIGALDSKCDFIKTDITPYTIDSDNQTLAQEQICMYYGVSADILKGDYNEDKFNAFYSSTIEPLAIQISEEFTKKIFTAGEIERGRRIIMSASRLTFANNATKMAICKDGIGLGLFTINECREVFEFEPVEGGDKRLISLNYADADKINQYQGVDNNDDEKNE